MTKTFAHKYKKLTPSSWLAKYNGKVHIDEKIANLISYAWKLEINTIGSCQETNNPWLPDKTKNCVWIHFSSINCAARFIDSIFKGKDKKEEWFLYSNCQTAHLYFPIKDIQYATRSLKKTYDHSNF